MKRFFTILASVFLVSYAFAQAPSRISFQAVIRNSSNELVTNTQIGMQISILQGSATGTVVYCETQTPETNANGLVSIEIGDGNILSGDFEAIDWSVGSYFIKTETDPTGSINYTISGTSQLLSVPYAMHAKTAESITGTITETDPVFIASPANEITVTDVTNWNNKLDFEIDGSVTNEIQVLSVSHDTIFLSSGGFVKLSETLLPPTVSAQAATNVIGFTATLNGTVNANNLLSTVEFEWDEFAWPTGSEITVTAIQSPVTGTSVTTVSANLTNIEPNRMHHFRLKAANAVNVSYSDYLTFTTPAVIPVVTTRPVNSITGISAVSGVNLIHDGGLPFLEMGLCWSLTPNPTLDDAHAVGFEFTSMDGLSIGTHYYVRAYATNPVGTAYGNQLEFTTVALPGVATSNFTDVKGISAKAGAHVTNTGGSSITAQGFCWSTSPNPTTSNNKTTSFTATMTGLTPNTVYYVRAYATNIAGTGYSNEIILNSGYEVGTALAGGLVFYNDGNAHGIVCAETDQSTNATWGCDGTNLDVTSTALGTGAANTNAIVLGCTASGIAAKLCYDLVLNTYDDWYLPSKDELYLLYVNLGSQGLGGFGSHTYWSSSEDESMHFYPVWVKYFLNDVQNVYGKASLISVRAVRNF